MKKKKIIITTISIFLVAILLGIVITCYQNDNEVITLDDGTTIALVVDGASSSTLPTSGGYKADITCENASAVWKYNEDNSEWEIELSDITGSVTCYAEFTSLTDDDLAVNYITNLLGDESSVTSGTGYLVNEGVAYYGDYTNATALAESNYGTTSQFSSTNATSTSGTSTTVWSYADDMWTSDSSSMSSGTLYHLSTTIDTSGYYQMCYSMTSGSTSNRLYVYVGGTAQTLSGSRTYLSALSSTTNSGCVSLGYIPSGTIVKFTQYAYTSISSMSVSLQLGSESVADAGIRYEGTDPDNHVWYNNELWQIIGVIPIVTENGTEDLVKIIRAEDIGAYAYDGKSSSYTGVWGSNTLYTLLNSYYWGKLNATDTDYCMGYSNYPSRCNFTTKGIDSSSYYGSMVEYVYWNTGASDGDVTPIVAYTNETASQTVGGYVGLMNASDYGYAYYNTTHSTNISSYSSSTYTSADWLYSTGETWTMTAYTSSTKALYVSNSGSVGDSSVSYYAYYGRAVRPVLYLKSADVYIADGDGSKTDPYILGTM